MIDRAHVSVPSARRRRGRPHGGVLVAALLLVVGMISAPPPALADTAPPVVGTAETVSTDPLPTVQIDGVVWDQVVVGNVVYVGGDFATARPAGAAAGTRTVPRSNLLAYDLLTGTLLPFAPTVNAPIRGLAVSPDGTRLYAAGLFTTVNGVARTRLAAFDVRTGTLVASFNPSISARANALAVTNTTVYVGGTFTTVQKQQRLRVAALRASDAALLPFAPTPSGGDVRALALSPTGTELVLGGNFTSVNGSTQPGYGLASVDATSGALRPFAVNAVIRNAGTSSAITSLAADATGVYGTGYTYGGGGNFEGSFKAGWSGGAIRWMEDCHGDTYSIVPAGANAYIAGHPHYCGNISTGGFPEKAPPSSYYRGLAFTNAATGTLKPNAVGSYASFTGQPAPTLQHWFPDFNIGTKTGTNQGPWDVTVAGSYVLYGGEFTQVNGTPQQGLVRFAVDTVAPNDDGPRLSGAAMRPTAAAAGTGTVRISWTANHDRDNSDLRYEVIRDGNTAAPIATARATSNFWKRPVLSVTNAGLVSGRTYTYRIRTVDPFGNATTGDSVSYTAP
jgi:hypothetical protein